ncbi:MAG: 16S rRNA (guanine(527)-N(7))-methyltransferase RsmG [Candidatus Sulfotelmatobacter sp.]
MQPARIAELLQPFLNDANDQRRATNDALYRYISTYIDILLRWNARINLTAIRDQEEIVTRHFGESLFAARHLFPCAYPAPSVVKDVDVAIDQRPRTNVRLADLGSGAGFPGIPIKLWAPDIALTLIESNHKKAAFLREVARSLTLTDINIQNARAETVALTQTFDVVTLRAVERFADILPVAARLLSPAARLALLIAAPQLDTARLILPQLTWQDPILIPQSKSRLLLIGTPEPSK